MKKAKKARKDISLMKKDILRKAIRPKANISSINSMNPKRSKHFSMKTMMVTMMKGTAISMNSMDRRKVAHIKKDITTSSTKPMVVVRKDMVKKDTIMKMKKVNDTAKHCFKFTWNIYI